ncbi:hypothetical protein [Actinomadura xylanilytica]|nr:hypothetical protein [Actinomadura xylanilytica]MDL4773943.1 hypothetical protein [Actinomadura xylanilytica]
MGLLLRPDAHYTKSDGGLYLLTHEGPVFLPGRAVHPLLTRLAPYLNGDRSLDELTANLSGERREMVRRLVVALIDRGVVRTGQRITPELPVPAEPLETPGGSAYRGEAGFLSYFRDSGHAAFQEYRNERAVVVGQGALVPAVAAAALRSGLAFVHLVTPDQGDALLPAVEEGRRDPEQRVTHATLGSAAFGPELKSATLVLHAAGGSADPLAADRAVRLERHCAAEEVDLVQVFAFEGAYWCTLSGPRLGIGPAWRSVELRCTARRPHQARDESSAPHAVATVVAAQVVAAQVVRRALLALSGVAAPGPGNVARFDPLTMTRREHAVVRHPFAAEAEVEPSTASAFRAAVAARHAAPCLDEAEFSRRAAQCVGEHLGVFSPPAERDFVQLPLRVCEIEVSDPVGLLGRETPLPRVIGAGLAFEAARLDAALAACSAHAVLMVDPRRLVDAEERPAFEPGTDAHLALSLLREGEADAHVHGYALTGRGEVRLVPAETVFPALRPRAVQDAGETGPPWVVPTGLASAYTWSDAVTTGVLAHVRRLALQESAEACGPSPRVELENVPLDAVGTRYLSILAALGEEAAVYAIGRSLPAFTMLCQVGGSVRGCASGLSAPDAIRDSLGAAILTYQARMHGQPAYAPTPPTPEPVHLGGGGSYRPDLGRAGLGAVLNGLAERGHAPVAVPLDHDPEMSAVMPNTVHVVMTDG